jgi:G3E family GTPase
MMILTGFLGSGKTTLLNAGLRTPDFAKAAVIVNEFADVGIDHQLIADVQTSSVLLDYLGTPQGGGAA